MEEFERQALLLDFYGALLTQKQRETYEDHVCNDISLSEIAEAEGISRQAVHVMIKRCTKTLDEYEEKLKLVERFLAIKDRVRQIDALAEQHEIKEISEMTRQILEEL